MSEELSGLSVAEDTLPSCQHHWVIQDSDGPNSVGVCRLCGALKQFKNFVEASHWGDDRSRSESRSNLLGRPARSKAILEDDEDC